MPTNHIFVYGSLRREFKSPARTVLEDHAEFVGQAVFQGKLYIIDWYPGVVESEDLDDVVHGEVYRFINKKVVLSKLDQYEGCSPGDPEPHEFLRKVMTVQLQNGKKLKTWMYMYDMLVTGKELIPSGDYVKAANSSNFSQRFCGIFRNLFLDK